MRVWESTLKAEILYHGSDLSPAFSQSTYGTLS